MDEVNLLCRLFNPPDLRDMQRDGVSSSERSYTPSGARVCEHSRPPPHSHMHGCDALSTSKTHDRVTSAAIAFLSREDERNGARVSPPTGCTVGRSNSKDPVTGIRPRAMTGRIIIGFHLRVTMIQSLEYFIFIMQEIQFFKSN